MPEITLFVCGDVMPGRGIDQILPHPSVPHLYEPIVGDAREYVALAEDAHGALPRRVDPAYVWGVALDELARRAPAARIINLETSVTTSDDAAPKGINYRMHPANVGVLTAARIDCAVLANNHVLDWGAAGLEETLDTLQGTRIPVAGAGRTLDAARTPAAITVEGRGRVLVLGIGGPDCGIPPDWGAGEARSGVFRIDDYSPAAVARIADAIARARREGDRVVVSIHWGGNWGYHVPEAHRRFAHELIDRAGVDLVHGHSSHHPKGIEVHRDRAILYGCGDFLNDYEGIPGESEFRGDLTFMYFVTLDGGTGALQQLELVPLRIRNFRLEHPPRDDRDWLFALMRRESAQLGTSLDARAGSLVLSGR